VRLGVGSTAIQVALALPHHCPEIASMNFLAYAPIPGVEERLTSSTNPLVRRTCLNAQRLRRNTRVDVSASDFIVGSPWPVHEFGAVLQEILHHKPQDHISKNFKLPARRLTSREIHKMRLACGRGVALALTSLCGLSDGETAHIPMVDFRCERSPENLSKLKLFLAAHLALPEGGYIVESERSYHFYGLTLLRGSSWIEFLAKCLLFAPLTDTRYIAHCLLHGRANLRITASERHKHEPQIVASVAGSRQTCI
jgi:hypothetical protein